MRRTITKIVFFLILIQLSVLLCSAISTKERDALIALYNSTNGDNWTTKTNWMDAKGTEGTWYGITVENIGGTDHVTRISLEDNMLEGIIPPELGNLSNLQYLYLANNNLKDTIPDELGNLLNLKEVTLDVNDLTGSIPNWLGNLSNLVLISLGYNDFSGNIPPELGNLSNLQYLYLDNNELTGTIPEELGNLTHLKEITLDVNDLTGSIPTWLGNLSNLVRITLGYNDFSGKIPPELGNLGNLQYLHLDNNDLTGAIPEELGNLSNLKEITLDVNDLIGSIPTWLGNLSNLIRISLGYNDLSENIPPELGNLSNLQYLDLSWNELTGTIPDELGNLSNLKEITLDKNYLTGSIPSDLGNLINLQRLCLCYNQLNGSIPLELGNLSNLQYLYLNNNQLSGPIPKSLTNLAKLNEPNVDIGYNCLFTNDASMRTWLNSLDPDWESHQAECSSMPPEICVNRSNLNFGASTACSATSSQTFLISNSGEGYLNWIITDNVTWLNYSSDAGIGPEVITVTVDVTGLLVGSYSAIIAVSDLNASNSPQLINVTLHIYNPHQTSAPFGSFSTPVEDSTVTSSIPVTGWALDDIELESVKIYREDGKNLIYIGDTVFVEGARPDIEEAYPDYPMNYKAGWGYMMLTNFLPNGGNGVFKVHAIATDKEGQTTTLGVKNITVDNANAVKPFGAIDTPSQGGTASGSNFVNWGWVLTPQPNSILTDGLTINVFVDGVKLGHPTYNIYRADIASLFPGYANSNGAVGYFQFDTTAYENGVHTIFWTVEDNAGNTDGIGSRYFTIQNSAGRMAHGAWPVAQRTVLPPDVLSKTPVDFTRSVGVVMGYRRNTNPQQIYPDYNGIANIEIRELDRLEIHLPHEISEIYGYMVVGRQLRPLPIGSTLDKKNNIFYWQLGPGFIGEYLFIFIEKGKNGGINRENIKVKIVPKFNEDGKNNFFNSL